MHLTITGYSTALFSTWYFIEEWGILFDAGEGLISALLQKSRKIDQVFITHADRDHITGLLQFLQLNARPGLPNIHYPKDSGSFPALETFSKKFDPHVARTVWTPITEGDEIAITKDLFIRPLRNGHVPVDQHIIKSLGYLVVQSRKKLRPEFDELYGTFKKYALSAGFPEVEENQWIKDHLAAGESTGEYFITSEYSRHSRYCAAPGLLLVGDAFAFLQKITEVVLRQGISLLRGKAQILDAFHGILRRSLPLEIGQSKIVLRPNFAFLRRLAVIFKRLGGILDGAFATSMGASQEEERPGISDRCFLPQLGHGNGLLRFSREGKVNARQAEP